MSVFDTLPGNFGVRAKAIVAEREKDGRNVRFVREDGRVDQFSLNTKERADGFRAALVRQGREIVA